METRDEFLRPLRQDSFCVELFLRARFTAAKSRSPISSAIARDPPRPATASFVSCNSSSTLAMTSVISLQSKPTRAAFVCAFWARSSAGRALVRPRKYGSPSSAFFSVRLIASHCRRTAPLSPRLAFAEDVRMPPNEFLRDLPRHFLDRETLFFARDLARASPACNSKSPSSSRKFASSCVANRLRDFVGFLEQARD